MAKKKTIYNFNSDEGYEEFKNDMVKIMKEIVEDRFEDVRLYQILLTSPSFINNMMFELEDVVDEVQSGRETYDLHDIVFKEMLYLIGYAVLGYYVDYEKDGYDN